MMVLRKIDELTQGDHSFIDINSNCYYFAEYPSGDNPENKKNPIYSLIHNIKKPMDRLGSTEWRYKVKDIETCSLVLRDLFLNSGNIGEFTLIPIPPSKIRDNPLYDPRMTQILEGVKPYFPQCDIKELLSCNFNMESSHESNVRPTIEELVQNYSINNDALVNCRNKIILFDDVLTTGAHFCAAKRKILDVFPEAEIYGFFIARRVLPRITDFDNDWLL